MRRLPLVWIDTRLPASTTGSLKSRRSTWGLAKTRCPAAGELFTKKAWASALIGAATSRAHARTTAMAPHRFNSATRKSPVTAATLEQGQRLLIDEVRRHLSQVNHPDGASTVDKNASRKPEGNPVRVGDLAVRIESCGELRPHLAEKAPHRRQRPTPRLVVGRPVTLPLAWSGIEERRPTRPAAQCLQPERGSASRGATPRRHQPGRSPSGSRM